MLWLTVLLFLILLPPTIYILILALASVYSPPMPDIVSSTPRHRFAIAIPAHDEESVIAATVSTLSRQNYPKELYRIFVVADHCSDDTAGSARRAGAVALERNEGPRSGKGGALNWAFPRIFDIFFCDAVVIFDADTQVDPNFLRIVDRKLDEGAKVIQGQHVISNPEQAWFPKLIWAMFLVDNRYQNLGRTNLKLSAKHMGDSICFRAEILKRMRWGEGLTDDYQSRHQLLMEGTKIIYEPHAVGYGEAPLTWAQAVVQRKRWIQGAKASSQRYKWDMLVEGLKRREPALIDGALQSLFPSYSTLTFLAIIGFLLSLISYWIAPDAVQSGNLTMVLIWLALLVLLFFYPFPGLALQRAPAAAYLVILTGPFYIVWRTLLALSTRFMKKPSTWVRTTHGQSGPVIK